MEMMHLIQQKLKSPKSQYNSFGKYHYRSCEDIVEALKPVLKEYGGHLILSDEVVAVGDRVYVKATASILVNGIVVGMATGYAREAVDRKGMDDSQITGATSSYARKYALNGLLAIDDTKDADTDEHTTQKKKEPQDTQKSDDDKPWYNDFDNHKAAMIAKIASGEATQNDIVNNLRKTFKVSNRVADQIRELR